MTFITQLFIQESLEFLKSNKCVKIFCLLLILMRLVRLWAAIISLLKDFSNSKNIKI